MTELSPWQKWKQAQGSTRPWDLVNPATEYASTDEASERLKICIACPRIIKITNQCKECGCFMNAKTRLKAAKCPLGKW